MGRTRKQCTPRGLGAVCFFFSTFGISDFALSTVLYRARKLVDDAKLPGTLNTQCAIPVAVIALAYISSIDVDQMTLVLLIVSQMIGTALAPVLSSRCRKAHKDVHGVRLVLAATLTSSLQASLGCFPQAVRRQSLTGELVWHGASVGLRCP